jgi:hypothetical protein
LEQERIRAEFVAKGEELARRQVALLAALPGQRGVGEYERSHEELVRQFINLTLERAILYEYQVEPYRVEHRSRAQLLLDAWGIAVAQRAGRENDLVLRNVDHYFTSRIGEALGATIRSISKESGGTNWSPELSWVAAIIYNDMKEAGFDMRSTDAPATPPGGLGWSGLGVRDAYLDASPTLSHPEPVTTIPSDALTPHPQPEPTAIHTSDQDAARRRGR